MIYRQLILSLPSVLVQMLPSQWDLLWPLHLQVWLVPNFVFIFIFLHSTITIWYYKIYLCILLILGGQEFLSRLLLLYSQHLARHIINIQSIYFDQGDQHKVMTWFNSRNKRSHYFKQVWHMLDIGEDVKMLQSLALDGHTMKKE